ncbi:MAG: sodium-dependent bicarbonate transport family permease [Microbacteriaceae bacterium]|nr:sodium-dependent bicarbonate transport family permease [Microbacteriaceae bacterium]
MSEISLALSSLTSVSVLVFILGFIASRLKSDLRVPDAIYQLISIFLLFGIGLKGGVGLAKADLTSAVVPLLLTISFGIATPFAAYLILKRLTRLDRIDLGSLAAHYGSTSLVTFSAALVFLDYQSINYGGFATALLAVMEIPGLIVGIYLGSRGSSRIGSETKLNWAATMHEIMLSRSILLLLGGLLIGFITGSPGYDKVTPFFVDLLPGVLALFLMHLGYVAGSQLEKLKEVGFKLVAFGLLFPIVSGSVAATVATVSGLSVGDSTVLAVLVASASYIAAPAAVSVALPSANHGLAITSALGVTFPFNLTLGIPTYLAIAELVGGLV